MSSPQTPGDGDIGAERAKQVAIDHWTKRHATDAWPTAFVHAAGREGAQYVIRLFPQNRIMLNFFVTYTVWVNARTGEVEKMT